MTVYLNSLLLATKPPELPLGDLGQGLAGLWQLLGVLMAFIFVMFLAYFATKWIASFRFAKQSMGNLQVVESIFIGQQANVQLIRVGEKFMLIGVTKERITMLGEVDPMDVDFSPDEPSYGSSFLSRLFALMTGKGNNEDTDDDDNVKIKNTTETFEAYWEKMMKKKQSKKDESEKNEPK